MPFIVVEGIPPWDGRYEFEDWQLTNRECHRIKEICGTRAGELLEALDSNDRGAFVALAAVIMERHGQRFDVDELWDAKAGSIRVDLGSDAGPPELPNSGDGSSEPSGNDDSSGADSGSSGG